MLLLLRYDSGVSALGAASTGYIIFYYCLGSYNFEKLPLGKFTEFFLMNYGLKCGSVFEIEA